MKDNDNKFTSRFEELKQEHRIMFPDTLATRYEVYRSWFNAGVKAATEEKEDNDPHWLFKDV